jgi:hypothetical protein
VQERESLLEQLELELGLREDEKLQLIDQVAKCTPRVCSRTHAHLLSSPSPSFFRPLSPV